MSSESHETRKERGFRGGDKEYLNKTGLCCPDTPRLGESTIAAYNNCDVLIRSDIQRTPSYVGYDDKRQSEVPQFVGRISHDNLERLYIGKVNESKLNHERKICSEEQPLDFSIKPISAVWKDEFLSKNLSSNCTITSQGSQENSANSSDCVDDSCKDEEKPERLTVYSHVNRTGSSKLVFHRNGSGNTVFDEREENLHTMSNRIFDQCTRRKEFKRNGFKAVNTSEPEDEYHSEYSVHYSRIYEPNGDHSRRESSCAAHLSAEGKKLPQSQHTISEMNHVSNHHSENVTNISTEKNYRFHIQGTHSRDNQSDSKEKHSEMAQQFKNSITQQKTSPHSNFNYLGKENNLPSMSISPRHIANIPLGSSSTGHSGNRPPEYTSPSQSMNLPPSRLPFGATDRFHASNRMISPYMQTVFPPNHIGNFMNHNSPGEASEYSRLYSYPSGSMLQPQFNPMYVQTYQQSLLVGQDQQRQKKQRPFKNIDPSILMQHLPTAQTAAALSIGPSPSTASNSSTIKYTESSESTVMDTSPQSLSQDSPCIVNGSSANPDESFPQDANGEPNRKKIRRMPEEKDEEYREERRKNNLAAKKCRAARKEKERSLAYFHQKCHVENIKLSIKSNMLLQNCKVKEQMLDMITSSLISFRERCEGRTKELFEETFKSFFPQQ